MRVGVLEASGSAHPQHYLSILGGLGGRVGRKGHPHWTAPGCQVMIHPFIQQTFAEHLEGLYPRPPEGWQQRPDKFPPSTVQGQISL